MNNRLEVSEHSRMMQIDDDSYVIWNRFFPSILKLNKAGQAFIKNFKRNNRTKINDKYKSLIEMLLQYHILFRGCSDRSKENFVKLVHRLFAKVDGNANEFYKNGTPYSRLVITNDSCNLECPYCVNKYKNSYSSAAVQYGEKLTLLNRIVDQFFLRISKNGNEGTKISFNGGEIILEWPLIKAMITRISEKYGNVKIEYSLNTNMTLMTEEIAKFLNRHNFKVYISIDGYKEAHDKTRKYHNGAGTFDDIIKGLEIFRTYNKNYLIKGFQGTIDNIDGFNPREVYEMKRYGFTEARLAPNLLNVSEVDAKKKAQLQGRFIDLNLENSFKVTEMYFRNMTKLINNDRYYLYFNCKGLSAYPDIDLSFNLNTLRMSQLCSYVHLASLPFKDMDYDIYSPKLWKRSYDFIFERIESLFENCMDCDLIGICRGGCIYTGLDKENKLNKSACIYQKELWKIFLEKIYNNSEASKEMN